MARPSIPRDCAYCGTAFLASSDKVRKGYGKFCSRACRRYPPFVDRLLDKFLVGDGCWEWQAGLSAGYGVIEKGGRMVRAHRAMFELFIGDVPEGKELDHLCRNRRCVRPSHLEPVPRRINILRGEGPTARLAQRTHCKNGHDLRLQADRTRGCGPCIANRARLRLGKVHITLGTYPTRTEADAAQHRAKKRLTALARIMKIDLTRRRRRSKTDEAAA